VGFLLQQAARSKRQTDSVEKLCRASLALLSRGSYSTTARLDSSVIRSLIPGLAIVILSSHYAYVSQLGYFLQVFLVLQFGMRFSCAQCVLHSTAHHIRRHVITLIIINEKYKLQIAMSLRNKAVLYRLDSTAIMSSNLTRGLSAWLLLVSLCASLCR
jgi:hypothetical protein